MEKAIIFDLDGTLLNTDTLIQKSFIHVFNKYKPVNIILNANDLKCRYLKEILSNFLEKNKIIYCDDNFALLYSKSD